MALGLCLTAPASASAFTADPGAPGTVEISTGDGPDSVLVSRNVADRHVVIEVADQELTDGDGTAGCAWDADQLQLSCPEYTVPVIRAGGGDDVLGVDGDPKVIAFGGAGNDSLFGGGGDDALFGESGRDSLDAGLGRNVAEGGDDEDQVTVSGSPGDTGDGGGDDVYSVPVVAAAR